MTGMGRASGRVGLAHLLVEAKSINHRYCEVSIRMPARFGYLEYDLVCLAKKKIGRGKVELTVIEEKKGEAILPDPVLIDHYYNFLKKIRKKYNLEGPLTLTHLLEGSSYWMSKPSQGREDGAGVKKLVLGALDKLIDMRALEGSHLGFAIARYLASLEELRQKVGMAQKNLVPLVRDRLKKRIEKNLSGIEVDPSRLAQEVVIFADKSDVEEELERLQSHHIQMRRMITLKKPVGRELDFLIQEMNREWNTIASKSQDADISHQAVEAKAILEQTREQVQNIE